jgi:hypothetical protein
LFTGAVQPAGRVKLTLPLTKGTSPALYCISRVTPVCPTRTSPGLTLAVPCPATGVTVSVALTLGVGVALGVTLGVGETL